MNGAIERGRKPSASGRTNQLGQAMGVKGLQTRRRLLDATQALLETSWVRDLRVASIARAAGASASTFYVYFDDVTDAVLALIGEVTQSPPSLLSLLQSEWPAHESFARAHAFARDYVQHWRQHAALFRIRNLASDEGDARFTLLRINAVSPLIDLMAGRIRKRQSAGAMPRDLDPQSVAGALLALIERIAVPRIPHPSYGITPDRLIDVAGFFAALVMGEGEMLQAELAAQRRAPLGTGPAVAAQGSPVVASDRNLQGQAIGRKGARTRDRIVQATDQLIRVRGLRDLAVADITRLARTSPSTFYLYFEDVGDVVLRLISQETQAAPELLQILQADCRTADVKALSLEFAQTYVERWQQHGPLFRVRNLAAEEGDERFIRARSEAVRPLLALLARRVSACQQRGALPGALHAASAAAAFTAMIERVAATPSINTGGPVTTENVNRAAAYFLSVLLCGIEARA